MRLGRWFVTAGRFRAWVYHSKVSGYEGTTLTFKWKARP